MLGTVAQSERKANGLSRRQLAEVTHMGESTIRGYECGKDMPREATAALVRALNSPRLMAQACYECPVNTLTPPVLDKVDEHPMTVHVKVMEELREALCSLDVLTSDLPNVHHRDELPSEGEERMGHAVKEMLDLYAALMTWIAAVAMKLGGYDAETLGLMMYDYLYERGYTSSRRPKWAQGRVVTA